MLPPVTVVEQAGGQGSSLCLCWVQSEPEIEDKRGEFLLRSRSRFLSPPIIHALKLLKLIAKNNTSSSPPRRAELPLGRESLLITLVFRYGKK